MAVKTITIDMEAYETLSRHKRPGQSFSEVIKEKLGPMKTGANLLQAVRRIRVSEDALAAMETVVRDRKRKGNTRDNWDLECTFEMMIINMPVNPSPAAGMLSINPDARRGPRKTLTGMPSPFSRCRSSRVVEAAAIDFSDVNG